MNAGFTPGPLVVRLDGTMTGVWAEIGQECADPATGETWFRELARTDTTHVRRDDSYPQNGGTSFLPYEEAPEQFQPTEDCDELLANARLWAAAPELYDALEHIAEYWNGAQAHDAMLDALNHIIETANAACAKARSEQVPA